MKNYLNKLGLLAMLLSLAACNLFELDEYLVDPSNVAPENAEVALVMNRVQFDFTRFIHLASDQTARYSRLIAMTGSVQYENHRQPASFDLMWQRAQAELIPDMDLVINQSDEGGFSLVAGAARVMKAYTLYTLVDLFGAVPYSEAQQGINNPSPRADSDVDVYNAANAIIEQAIADLSTPTGSFDNDLYYDGSAEAWLKLANTIKLRRLVQTRLVNADAGAINSIVSSGNIIDETSEDFQWQYGTSLANPDSRHPYYEDAYSNAPAVYHGNYYMWLLFGDKPVTDPRLRYYFYRQDCDETDENAFTLDCVAEPYPSHWPNGFPFCTASLDDADFSGYWGRDHGNADGIPPDGPKRTVFGLYPAGGKFDADDCASVQNNGADGARGAGIQPIALAAWTHFLLAEAALTIPGVNGDPLELLKTAIQLHMDKVTNFQRGQVAVDFAATDDDVTAYITTVENSYNAATTNEERMAVIGKEFFLALHGMGIDAFNLYRRTGAPRNAQPTEIDGAGPFPRTFWYPANYVNRNQNATQRANLTTQVFWDTNPATGFIY